MRRRVNLLIFVLVSLALEDSRRASDSDLSAQPGCHRKRDSIGAGLMIDELGIAIYAALRAERGRDGALVTEGPDRIVTCRLARRNDV
jgi:hypothetical protein